MPRAGLTDSRPGPSYRHPSDKKFASSPPNSASSSPAPSIRGGHHQRQKLSPPLPPAALQAEATSSHNSFKSSPAMSTSHPKRIPLPGRRQSKSSTRKVSRPERKASVRKESYDLDEDQEDDDDMDDSDLSDAPSLPGSLPDHSDSDGEMAAKLQAAGDGESLLGSGESGDEQEDDEERYIVAETQAKSRSSMKARQRARRAGDDGASASAGAGADDDHDGVNATFSDIGGPISPNTMRILGDELLQEQTGFHSDSEPSFTDFFASDDEGLHPADDEGDDDEELTSDDDTDSEDQDISDIEGTLMDMGEPFLAHVGAVNGAPQTAEQLQAAMEAGAQIAAQDIPLLVIEDLDGRLIYARAGDGEAVFGSDGEFEFVDESSSDEDTDDEDDVPTAASGMAVDARDPRWAATASQWSRQESDVFQDDGDTTDELPDEEMPFPRLLVGSVDPRGGRTSRRARALAAQMRRLSPNAPGPSTAGPSAEAGPSMEPSPAPLASPSKPSSSTASSSATPVTPSAANARTSPDVARPAMGSFMPSSTKSVHRAVIDGSSQAASPFTSKYSLQRRGLAGKRRSRRTSLATGAASSSKRARHDDTSEAPSSPEVSNAPLAMDLDDVVDGSMLWRSSDSSDDEQESDAASESTTAAGAATDGTRSRTTSMSSAAPSGGFGLNSSAFSRWRRIPMNAFRDQQQQQRGATAAVERGPAQPVMGGNFLLQRVARNGNNKRDEQQSSPFRRTGSLGSSSLHMVVPSPHAAGDQQRSIVVSPVLWPVRGGPQAQDASTSNMPALPAAAMGTPHGKMTKKEKRERKAKRAAARAAARADKQRLQVDHIFGENEAGRSGMVASAPSTPTVGGTSALPAPPPASLSPSSAMPRLSLTEASPRASPARDEQQQQRSLGTMAAVAAAASHAQPQRLQPHEQHNNDGSTLPGNTPPTRAVAGNGAVPSLPSSTFGGPMTSPLFGGLFAPLNMSAQDEGELEGQGGRGGEALRI